MKGFCALLLVIYPFIITGYVQAVAFPEENRGNEASQVHKPTETDENQITQLRDQVIRLQQAFTEITRSLLTLELAAKDPSISLVEAPKARDKRDVDPLPSQSPTSSSPDEEQNPVAVGSFTWPLRPGPCYTCPAGIPGRRGLPGLQGIMGRDGRDGRDAVTQPEVQEPPTSPPDIHPVGNSSQSGVIYIRWGSNVCPERAELVYKGTVGGAYFSHAGGGANYLCMPDEPIYDEIETSAHADRAQLFSAEYQTSLAPSRLRPMHDHTPTCSVCRAPSGRTTKVMIPARNVCPSAEWRLEYAGYLMAAHPSHQRTEHVCVDRAMDVEPRSAGNQDGALFYMVEGRCQTGGGLPCGPYVNGYELTCAVCTI